MRTITQPRAQAAFRRPGVSFTKQMAQSTNVQEVILLCQHSFFCSVQFHQQIYTQLYLYTQLENMLSVYDALFFFSINLQRIFYHLEQ